MLDFFKWIHFWYASTYRPLIKPLIRKSKFNISSNIFKSYNSEVYIQDFNYSYHVLNMQIHYYVCSKHEMKIFSIFLKNSLQTCYMYIDWFYHCIEEPAEKKVVLMKASIQSCVHDSLDITRNIETLVRDVLVILKRMLLNFLNILAFCKISTISLKNGPLKIFK